MSAKKPSPRSPRSAEESRAALVAAGIRLFATRGFDGTTTRDIARESGLNLSLIKYYFGDKEGLLDACLEAASRGGIGAAVEALGAPRTPADFERQLGEFARRFIEGHLGNPFFHKLVQKEVDRASPSFDRVMKKEFLRNLQRLIRFFEEAQEHGLVDRALDAVTVALSLNGALVQHVRLDPYRKQLTGKSLASAPFREAVLGDVLRIFGRGAVGEA